MANFNEQTAKEFLQRTMTVVGSSAAIEDQNGTFLKKYATVVNSKDAIKIVAPETTGSTGAQTGSTSEQGQTVSNDEQGQTVSNDEQGATGSTGAQTGSTSEQGATSSTDAGAGEGTDNQGD